MKKNVLLILVILIILVGSTACSTQTEDAQVNHAAASDDAAGAVDERSDGLPMEISIPMTAADIDELMVDRGSPFSPDSLQNVGGNLLTDSQYSYTIQYPAEWDFTGSAELGEARSVQLTAIAGNHAANETEQPASDAPTAYHLIHAAEFTRTKRLSVFDDCIVSIMYRYFDTSFDEAVKLEWVADYARIIGIGGELSRIDEPERVVIGDVEAYRFSLQLDYSEYRDGLRFEYIYVLPISDNVFARFDIAVNDTDNLDEVDIEKFHTAMETFAKT